MILYLILKKLSPIKKFILVIFTVFTAIPNKFWINVNIDFYLGFCDLSISLFFGNYFPLNFFMLLYLFDFMFRKFFIWIIV